ncbi:hypothetical protein llap_3431 [Limosa lapponica baueri]|uniref:Uncharacterized protein n=1 Tax=Limosa lapponica baueri TaxID=1758121 RepID=A0A2I0UJP3_LIMLA|nr:hypothetical protein llap_3431 [Limosa lapponica baueri]
MQLGETNIPSCWETLQEIHKAETSFRNYVLECKMEREDPVLRGADGEEELPVLSPVPSSTSWIIRVLRRSGTIHPIDTLPPCTVANSEGHRESVEPGVTLELTEEECRVRGELLNEEEFLHYGKQKQRSTCKAEVSIVLNKCLSQRAMTGNLRIQNNALDSLIDNAIT